MKWMEFFIYTTVMAWSYNIRDFLRFYEFQELNALIVIRIFPFGVVSLVACTYIVYFSICRNYEIAKHHFKNKE